MMKKAKLLKWISVLVVLAMAASMTLLGGYASEEPVPAADAIEEAATAEEAPARVETESVSEEPETPADEPAENVLDGAPPDAPPDGGGGGGGGGSSSATYNSANMITSAATLTDGNYYSNTDNWNAIHVNTKSAVSIVNPTVLKDGGGGNGDAYSFYGINAAIMVRGGSTTTITGGTITTKADGANAVFCFGGYANTNNTKTDGTTVNISGTKIVTTGGGSGGIMTTGGGTTNAYDLDITTSGGSSAAIRTDRGGGNVNVYGGSYTTNGVGSPVIYATATIKVHDATLISTASQGVVNEGGNDVYLYNCTLNAGNKTRNGQDWFNNGIFLYQSMSGDAADGASVFEMHGGTLNNTYGHVFHVTNTSAAITLEGVEINNKDSAGVFLSVCDDAWSSSGKLGNTAKLTASGQVIEGTMLVGSNATLNLFLTDGSSWTGSTSGNIKSHKTSSTVSSSIGTVNVTLDASSTWTLTADTTISRLTDNGVTNYSNINLNGYKLTVGGKTITSTDYQEWDPLDYNKDGSVDIRDASAAIAVGTRNAYMDAVTILMRCFDL